MERKSPAGDCAANSTGVIRLPRRWTRIQPSNNRNFIIKSHVESNIAKGILPLVFCNCEVWRKNHFYLMLMKSVGSLGWNALRGCGTRGPRVLHGCGCHHRSQVSGFYLLKIKKNNLFSQTFSPGASEHWRYGNGRGYCRDTLAQNAWIYTTLRPNMPKYFIIEIKDRRWNR